MTFFIEMSLLLTLTAACSFVLHKIKQPLVIAYILAGILAGPYFFNWLQSSHELEIFSQAGIVFLLFIVGIHLNPQVIKEVGLVALVTGVGQIVFTSAIGYLLALALGFPPLAALYMAIALTFSSTIIIMKLISDKKELDSLYAKISIGFLLVQDLAATLILVLLPVMTQSTGAGLLPTIGWLSLKLTLLVVFLVVAARWLLPWLMRQAAASAELLFISAVTWGVGVAALFAWSGLSLEVGALAAGIALSTSAFAEEISSRLRPLRDFFLVVFFLLLGSGLAFTQLGSIIVPALLLSLFVLVGNPLIVYLLMQLLGYTRKTSFQAGLTVAQISEFSLILIALGAQLNQVSATVVSVITMVGIITIAASTYAILYSQQLFEWLEPFLKLLPSRQRTITDDTASHTHRLLWFGYHPVGEKLLQDRTSHKYHLTIIDHNPQHIEELNQEGVTALFGDASNAEFLSELPWHEVDVVVSFLPSHEANLLIIQQAQEVPVFVLSKTESDATVLYESGAHEVIMPYHLSLDHLLGKLTKFKRKRKK